MTWLHDGKNLIINGIICPLTEEERLTVMAFESDNAT